MGVLRDVKGFMEALKRLWMFRLALPLWTYVSFGLTMGGVLEVIVSPPRSGLDARLPRRLPRVLPGRVDGAELSGVRRVNAGGSSSDKESKSSELTQSRGVLSPDPGA